MCSGEGEMVAVMLLGKEDIANLLLSTPAKDRMESQASQDYLAISWQITLIYY